MRFYEVHILNTPNISYFQKKYSVYIDNVETPLETKQQETVYTERDSTGRMKLLLEAWHGAFLKGGEKKDKRKKIKAEKKNLLSLIHI